MTRSQRAADTSGLAAPTGTVTFLFTDVEGSTRLLEGLRADYATLLAELRDLLRGAFARWDGFEVDTQGDSFFVAFPRAIDAVQCAVEAQREIMAHRWPQGAEVRVRMGLHTGEPVIARTGYVGMDVHRAARVGAAGHGGQVLLSGTTRQLVAQQLPDGVDLVDLGEHRLKDVRSPIPIFQVAAVGLIMDHPPLRTLATGDEPPTPGEPPYLGLQHFDVDDRERFFGRGRLTQHLVERVRELRFLAIVGASGSGKSSLARAGLVPELLSVARPRWSVHVMTPTAHPLAGALAIRPDIRVAVTYLAAPPEALAFDAPQLAQEAAAAMYADGADVIFHAAGDSGIGVFEAANRLSTSDLQLWAIGVDSDQAATVASLPGVVDSAEWQAHILTSMIKRPTEPCTRLSGSSLKASSDRVPASSAWTREPSTFLTPVASSTSSGHASRC